MSQYGCTIPRRGRALIAKILAEKMPLKISRIMMGQGVCPEDVFPGDLEDLVEPVAAGTSTEPTYDGDTVHMMVEYRSDLNGGLDRGFWIREFGVFAKDLDGSEVMLYYGTLGDYPQWVSAYSQQGLDTRRYPVDISDNAWNVNSNGNTSNNNCSNTGYYLRPALMDKPDQVGEKPNAAPHLQRGPYPIQLLRVGEG